MSSLLLTVLLIIGSVGFVQMAAQTASLEDASKLAIAGKYEAAGMVYNQLLDKNPEDLGLLVGKGFNLSWQGRYNEAKQVFAEILKKYPGQADAISGMAYTLAWNGEYGKSKSFFGKLLKTKPGNLEALKGLAYVALWEKKVGEAIRRFESLTDSLPNDGDIYVSLAQAYLLASKHIASRRLLRKALTINPKHNAANELYARLSSTQAWVEVNLWGGYTRINALDKAGLRAARISWKASHDLQLWLRYDNALTFDNFALVRGQREVGAWFLGGVHNWNEKTTTRFELGHRQPDSNLSQIFIQGEQVFYMPGNAAIKLGGFYGPRGDGTLEWMSYVGGVLPFSSSFRIEPTYFYAKNTVTQGDDQRFLLAANYQLPRGIELNGGLQYGMFTLEGSRQNLIGGHLISQIPVGLHWIQGLIRYESSPGATLVIGAFGIRFRLER